MVNHPDLNKVVVLREFPADAVPLKNDVPL